MPVFVEAALGALDLELQLHRAARRQRLGESIDAIARLAVIRDELCRANRRHAQLRARQQRDVQVADRCRSLVHELIATADLDATLCRIDVHVRVHVRDARLRQVLVLAVRPSKCACRSSTTSDGR